MGGGDEKGQFKQYSRILLVNSQKEDNNVDSNFDHWNLLFVFHFLENSGGIIEVLVINISEVWKCKERVSKKKKKLHSGNKSGTQPYPNSYNYILQPKNLVNERY